MERNYINSQEFEEWLTRNDPDQVRVEAAATLAQMNMAITITPIELLTISEASDQLAVERNFIADAKRIVREREASDALARILSAQADREVRRARVRKAWARARIVMLWVVCLGCAAFLVTR